MALIEGNDPFGRPIVDQQASAAAASQMPYADPGYQVPVGGPYPASYPDYTPHLDPNVVLDPSQAGTGLGHPIGGSATPGAGASQPSSRAAHPDYNYLLANDPNYQGTVNDLDAQLKRAAAEKDAAMKALEYAFKGNPTYSTMAQYNRNLQQVESEYTRNVKNLESEYTYNRGNTQFDADRALQLAMRQLAGRNALTSGEKPWAQEENQIALSRALHGLDYQHSEQRHQYDFGHTNDVYGLKLGEFNSEQQYADAVANALKAYTTTSDEVARAKRQAAIDAANSLAANPVYQY